MGLDRAIGAQGLDDPAELALASVMLGHIEAAGNTRYDSTDPRGEAVGSWQVGYSTTASGIVEPGAGGSIPTQGPYQVCTAAYFVVCNHAFTHTSTVRRWRFGRQVCRTKRRQMRIHNAVQRSSTRLLCNELCIVIFSTFHNGDRVTGCAHSWKKKSGRRCYQA